MDRIDQLKKLLSSLTGEALENHIGDAEKCALESINPGVDDDKPIRAKISLAVEWDAGGTSPKAKVKASYSVKKTETYESDEDFNQLEMFSPVKNKGE